MSYQQQDVNRLKIEIETKTVEEVESIVLDAITGNSEEVINTFFGVIRTELIRVSIAHLNEESFSRLDELEKRSNELQKLQDRIEIALKYTDENKVKTKYEKEAKKDIKRKEFLPVVRFGSIDEISKIVSKVVNEEDQETKKVLEAVLGNEIYRKVTKVDEERQSRVKKLREFSEQIYKTIKPSEEETLIPDIYGLVPREPNKLNIPYNASDWTDISR